MVEKIIRFLSELTAGRIVLFLFTALMTFLLTYVLFIKKYIMDLISVNDDLADRKYYMSIFSNLEYSIIFTIILVALIYAFRSIIFSVLFRLNDKMLLITAVALNIIWQFIILIFIETLPIADSIYYIGLAENLYMKGSYLNNSGYPACFWPVGFPVYMASLKYLFNDFIIPARILNILLSSFFIMILFGIFRHELNRKEKIIFLLLFVFFLNNLFSANILMTDYPFSFLLWFIVFILVKHDKAIFFLFVIGIILGLMAYLRPIGILFPLLFFIYWLKYFGLKKALKKLMIISAVMIILLAPWIYRNYIIFGKFIPVSCNGGYNFLMGNHKLSSGGLNFNFNYDFNNPNEPQEEQRAYSRAFKDIFSNPYTTLIRLPKKILYSYLRGDSSVTWALKITKNNISPLFLSFMFFMANFSFYTVLIVGILSFPKKYLFKDPKLKNLLILIFIFTIILIIIFVGGERYIIPVLPVHFFLFTKFFSNDY